MGAEAVPHGYGTVTPYLVVPGVARVIEFLKRVFDACEIGERMSRPGGGVMHAEVRIGSSRVMMGEPMEGFPPVPAMLYVYVADVDAAYERALAAAGTSMREPKDEFYGDRSAGVKDSSGNIWWIATHQEDVSNAEIQRRAETAVQRK